VVLATNWRRLSRSDSAQEFQTWLETATPETANDTTTGNALDSLDGFLLGIIVELEQLEEAGDPAGFEAALQGIWARTFARITSQRAELLSQFFLVRARALRTRIYPDANRRRALYRVGLPPRQAQELDAASDDISELLVRGADYGIWSPEERLGFIIEVADKINQQTRFRFKARAGRRNADWKQVLSWWLSPHTAQHRPDAAVVADWHRYVNDNFIYRLNWGLGCFFAKRLSDLDNGEPQELSLARWPEFGLPWAAFWLKELITWGTLDPVAAHLLSHRLANTRAEAEAAAGRYYLSAGVAGSPDALLDASAVRRWVRDMVPGRVPDAPQAAATLPATLSRDFGDRAGEAFRVLPVRVGGTIAWTDPAGYELARSEVPDHWREDVFDNWDFSLDPRERTVMAEPY
jgi:hypothetical protein